MPRGSGHRGAKTHTDVIKTSLIEGRGYSLNRGMSKSRATKNFGHLTLLNDGIAAAQFFGVQGYIPANCAKRTDCWCLLTVDDEFEGSRIAGEQDQTGAVGDLILVTFPQKACHDEPINAVISNLNPTVEFCLNGYTAGPIGCPNFRGRGGLCRERRNFGRARRGRVRPGFGRRCR